MLIRYINLEGSNLNNSKLMQEVIIMHILLWYPINKFSVLSRIVLRVMRGRSRVISMMFMILKSSSYYLTTTVVTPIMY